MAELGKIFIFLGLILIGIGVIVVLSERFPGIGRLPGDIFIKKEHFTFYFPLTTSLLLSLIISFLLIIFHKKQP